MADIRSGVILAGGSGRRIGSEKAVLEFFGRTMIEWAVDLVREVAQDVVVVARDENQLERLQELIPDASFACDKVPDYGPVAGLAAGMISARGKYALAVGCDLPFLSSAVLDKLFQLAEGYDAAVPVRPDGILETLHAVYRADRMADACFRAVDQRLQKVLAPLEKIDVNRVAVEELRSADPLLLSFFNINTEEDLDAARRIWTEKKVQKCRWSRR